MKEIKIVGVDYVDRKNEIVKIAFKLGDKCAIFQLPSIVIDISSENKTITIYLNFKDIMRNSYLCIKYSQIGLSDDSKFSLNYIQNQLIGDFLYMYFSINEYQD